MLKQLKKMTKKIENYIEGITDIDVIEDMEDQFKNVWYQLKYFLYNTHK